MIGSSICSISAASGQLARVVDLDHVAVACRDAVAHAGRGGDQVEVEFALQPLLHDLHVQQAEEAAAEAKAQRRRSFRLEVERRVVEPQLLQRIAQQFVLVRRPPGRARQKTIGLTSWKPGSGSAAGSVVVGDGVADLRVGTVLMLANMKPTSPAASSSHGDRLGRLRTPSPSTSNILPVGHKRIFCPCGACRR